MTGEIRDELILCARPRLVFQAERLRFTVNAGGSHAVNSEAIMMYWQVGLRIKQDLLKSKRAAYGEELVRKASDYLVGQFGPGWGFQTVRHCVRIAYTIELDALAFAYGG